MIEDKINIYGAGDDMRNINIEAIKPGIFPRYL